MKEGEQGYILPFLSKKCIFRAEKGNFSKSSFYTKMICDPKVTFPVSQKHFFVVSSKVSIFHQIQPTYVDTNTLTLNSDSGSIVQWRASCLLEDKRHFHG